SGHRFITSSAAASRSSRCQCWRSSVRQAWSCRVRSSGRSSRRQALPGASSTGCWLDGAPEHKEFDRPERGRTMLAALLRCFAGYLVACLTAGLVQVFFVLPPHELVFAGADLLSAAGI